MCVGGVAEGCNTGETRDILQVSKVGRQRGQPSSGRWRQENAAGEAAERISAQSGIGAGMITYKSMAMAAGEDDADNSSPGGSHLLGIGVRQRSGSLYKYLWRLRCESPLVRSWRRARQRWGPLNKYLSLPDVDSRWSELMQAHSASTVGDLRIMNQVEELRGCDKRLTACMLDRLGDLQSALLFCAHRSSFSRLRAASIWIQKMMQFIQSPAGYRYPAQFYWAVPCPSLLIPRGPGPVCAIVHTHSI